MGLQDVRIARAERRVIEAEANVERQKAKLQKLESDGNRVGLSPAREVLLAFQDLLDATRQRLREMRHRHKKNALPS